MIKIDEWSEEWLVDRLQKLKKKYSEKKDYHIKELADIPREDGFERGLHRASEIICGNVVKDLERILKMYY